jgi:hypothetical protein
VVIYVFVEVAVLNTWKDKFLNALFAAKNQVIFWRWKGNKGEFLKYSKLIALLIE